VSIAMDSSKDYGLTPQQASAVREQVQAAVSEWQQEANRLHIPEAEQSLMAVAFQI
jgi:hypothetical protein